MTEITNTKYRTSDGGADYVFDFTSGPDGWRVYIVRQPDYRGRAVSMNATHRLSDAGRHYICWDQPLATLDDAKGVAALWADATQEYIRTGRFAASADRSHVYDTSTSKDFGDDHRSPAGQPRAPALRPAAALVPARTPAEGPRATAFARFIQGCRRFFG